MNRENFKQYFGIAWTNLTHRKKRAYLTIIGVFIGIMAVVALFSLGEGLKQGVDAEFAKLGADKLFIQPASDFGGAQFAPKPLTENDLDRVQGTNGVRQALGSSYQSARVEWGDELVFPLVGHYPAQEEDTELFVQSWAVDLTSGRALEPGDDSKVVISYDYTDRAKFQETLGLGDRVDVNNRSFSVVGIRKRIGNEFDDGMVFLTHDAYREVVNDADEYAMIIAQTQPGDAPAAVAERVERELRSERDVREGNEDFSVETSEDLQETVGQVIGIIQIVLTGIAMISLIVGAVGIMNTMYTAVLERTKEIGIMKAVGATNEAILSIFLIESGLLGLAGGLVGVALGLSISFATAGVAGAALGTTFVQAYVSWELIAGSLAFGFIVGALAGFLPARQAASMNPVDSLHYE